MDKLAKYPRPVSKAGGGLSVVGGKLAAEGQRLSDHPDDWPRHGEGAFSPEAPGTRTGTLSNELLADGGLPIAARNKG